ncbi:hypothetical protein SAMN04488564_102235 [Lentzea waywayandensis]|uniref:Uncharacterized protein n=1 Tax=Lentzea waywayandensis TaxID=84724 RepID=A0A1I6DC60_9PSEU|nr:hypothetical protein [Lentzea waywayandensis]SFR03040.1 hypothetical protein SAMN04488564_102235 [Lentzea waywayandensis]
MTTSTTGRPAMFGIACAGSVTDACPPFRFDAGAGEPARSEVAS